MKTFERLLGLIIIALWVLKITIDPLFVDFLLCISILLIALFYVFLGFAFLNKIKLKDIFKRNAYKEATASTIIIAILAGNALSEVCLGLLFEILHWYGTFPLAVGSLTYSAFVVLTSLVLLLFQKSHTPFYKRVIARLLLISGFCFVLLLF